MLRTADRSPQRSYSGNLHCSPATESHLHLTEARARQHRSRNGGDGRGAFRAIFEMVQKLGWYKNPPFDFSLYKLTGRPAHDGLAQVDYSGRRSGALLRGSGTHHLRGQPRGLFSCGSLSIIIAVRQWPLNSRRLGQLSPGQSGPRMWSSTLQRSVRLSGMQDGAF